MGLMGVMRLMSGKPEKQIHPAQRGSKNSKLGVLGILRSLRILGEQPVIENGSPQRDSKMSNGVLLAIRPVPQSGDPVCYAGRMGRMEYLLCS